MSPPPVATLPDVRDELGEGPVWDAASGRLLWFDVVGRRLHRWSPDGGRAPDVDLPGLPGALALRAGGGFLLAFRNRIALADGPEGPWRTVCEGAIDFGAERINDGAVDAAGRFWFGTFSPRDEPGAGALYRLDPDLRLTRMAGGINLSNGIAWSPDHRILYHCDSRPGRIWRHPFDLAAGTVGPREVFVDYAGRPGRPDGCATDAEGGLWVAEVTAARVARYAPDGRLDRTIALPVSKPTSVAFVGAGLRTLAITSMRLGLSEAEIAREPEAGALFLADPGVAGRPEPTFAG